MKFVAHAIDTLDGTVKWSVDINGPATNDPSVSMGAERLLQRPALFVMDGVIYAAFGGFCDEASYHGWVVGISTSGTVLTRWTDEANQAIASPQGGIWQGAGPIMSDKPGQLLVVTANGNNPAVGPVTDPRPAPWGNRSCGSPCNPITRCVPVDYFSPANADDLSAADLGIGSGAAELLPSEYFGTPTVPNLAVTGSKHGSIYVVDRSFLGGRGQGPSGGDGIVQRFDDVGPMWSTPAFWVGDGGYFYQTVAFHGLQAYQQGVGAGDVPAFTLAASTGPVGYGSSSPIVTSDGTTSGSALVWMVVRLDAGDELRAYDAVPVNGQFHLRAKFPVGRFAKFNRITVAGGRVYVGTLDGRVLAFGLRTTGATGEFTAISPNRILDTRIGLGRPGESTTPLGEGATYEVQVTGTVGHPIVACSARGGPERHRDRADGDEFPADLADVGGGATCRLEPELRRGPDRAESRDRPAQHHRQAQRVQQVRRRPRDLRRRGLLRELRRRPGESIPLAGAESALRHAVTAARRSAQARPSPSMCSGRAAFRVRAPVSLQS